MSNSCFRCVGERSDAILWETHQKKLISYFLRYCIKLPVLQFSLSVACAFQFRNISIQNWENLYILVTTEHSENLDFTSRSSVDINLTNPSSFLYFPICKQRLSILKLLWEAKMYFSVYKTKILVEMGLAITVIEDFILWFGRHKCLCATVFTVKL